MKPARHTIVYRMLLIDGILLIALAFVHLLETPIISKGLARELNVQTLLHASPSFLFNHLLIGILLIPFGISTLYTAAGVRVGQPLARWVAFLNAVGVLVLPLFVGLLAGVEYYVSLPFLIAAVVITLIGISMFLALLWMREKPKSE